MIKKDIIETEVRTSGFKQVQADIAETSGKIDAHRDTLKKLQHQRALLVSEGKKESQEYRNLTKEINTVNKSIKEETQILSAHYSKLNLGEMSYNQLKRRASELAKELKGVSKAAEPERFAKLEQELDRVNKQMGKMQAGAKQTQGVLTTTLGVFAGNLMTKAIGKLAEWGKAAFDWIKQGTEMAAKAEGVQTAFNKLNNKDLLKNLREATKGTINDLTLMQSAVKADKFQIPVEKLGSLLKFAQQRAQETGESVEYLSKSIIDGIGRKSPLILDNLGISAQRLKDRVKETGDFTTAAIAIVNEELEKQGTLALTSADKAQQSAVKWENAQRRIGERFLWLKNTWSAVSGFFADTLSAIAGDTRTATEKFEEQRNTVIKLNSDIRPLADRYDKLKEKVKLSTEEQAELKRVTKALADEVPWAVTAWGEYGEALSINTDKIYEHIRAQQLMMQETNKESIKSKNKEKQKTESKIEDFEEDARKAKRNLDYWQKQVDDAQKLGLPNHILQGRLKELEKYQTKYSEKIAKLNEQKTKLEEIDIVLAGLTGDSYAEGLHRHQFSKMNEEALKEWINNEENAAHKYIDIAKEVLAAKQAALGGGGGGGDPKPTKTTWSLNNDKDFQQARAALKEQQLSGEIATEKEYKDQLLQLEINTLQNRIALNRDGADTLRTLQEQLTDKLLEQRKAQTDEELKLNKLIADSQTDLVAKEKQAYQERLKLYGLEGAEAQALKRQQVGEDMVAQFGQGNVDLLARPLIDAAELVKKGWEDAGEGIATVFSSQMGVMDAEGKIIEILVTPILPDGTILSPEELDDYVYNQLEGAENLLAADSKGIVIAVDVDINGEAGEQLHLLQEAYYEELALTDAQKQALEVMNREHQKNIDKIENDAMAAHITKMQKDFERELTLKKTKNNEELAGIQNLEQAKTLLRDQYGVEDLTAIKTLAEARARIQKEQNKQIEVDTANHLSELMILLQEAMDYDRFDGLDMGTAILSEEQKEELLKRLEEVKLKYAEILAAQAAGEDTGSKKGKGSGYSFQRGSKPDLLGMTPDDWETFFENVKDGKLGIEDILAVASMLTAAFAQYDSFATAAENRQLKEFQKNNDKKKSQLKNRLDAGRMSQEQYNAAIEAMDAEYDRKKEEIELKQARRKKAQAIIDSMINTAIAVTEAYPNMPLAITVGILGGIQTALIAAMPVAGREEGGLIVEREQDGKKFNAEFAPQKRGKVTKPTVIVGENGNEYVIPADGYDNPTLAPIIRTIEDARLRGNLRSFDFNNVQPVHVVGREVGGFATDSPVGGNPENTYTTPGTGDNTALIAVLERLSALLDKPLTAIVSILGKNGIKEKMEEYERSRNKGKLA